MLEITASIGPFNTFTVVVNGKVVAIVRKVRDQWLLTDRIGGSPFESQFIKTAKTNCKGFKSKLEARKFIKKHYN